MQALEKIAISNNWVTLLLLTLFMIIFFLKSMDAQKLKENVFAIFNVNFIQDDSSDFEPIYDAFQIVIFAFSIFVFSLLAYHFKLFYIEEQPKNFNSFVTVFIWILSYFVIKRVLEYLITSLFSIKKKIRGFIKIKSNYLYSIATLIYAAIIVFEYANLEVRYLFYFSGLLIVLRFLFYILRNKNLILNKLFYFILYICAFEIAPLFILFKMMF